MQSRTSPASIVFAVALGSLPILALDAHKELSQYTHTVYTQEQGLPQDTVRAIAQTRDGYLWIGTNDGLGRFDGYDFVTFTKRDGFLPSQRVRTLLATRGGDLWIGTNHGLVQHAGGKFTTMTEANGLLPEMIDGLTEDRDGVIWVISGENLFYRDMNHFVAVPRQKVPWIGHPEVLYQDDNHELWLASTGSVLKRTAGGFSVVLGPQDLQGDITCLWSDATGLWVGGAKGVLLLKKDGSKKQFTIKDGLPNDFVRALWKDRAGNLWAGTYGGLSRFENGRFIGASMDGNEDHDWIWCMYEDREGDFWVGTNSALIRLRDSRFTMYGRPEGLPGDEPNVVHQDPTGRIWVGYHSSGLLQMSSPNVEFTVHNGLPSNDIFGIYDARDGDLLLVSRGGLSRMHNGSFINYALPDPQHRRAVYSAIEDAYGRVWAGNASGLYRLDGRVWTPVLMNRANTNDFTIALVEGPKGTLWTGTMTGGLTQIIYGAGQAVTIRRFTARDGLSGDPIRSLYAEKNGTLWIGTIDGGLAELRQGKFYHFTSRDGLYSDSISHVEDDGQGNLWLSTTRGLSRIPRQQLGNFIAGKIHKLTPENFGTADGLRSMQCGPGAPAGSGAARTFDGRLLFPTSGGVASIRVDSLTHEIPAPPPSARILEVSADGHSVDLSGGAKLGPGTSKIQFKYTGVYLSAPERVQYSYKLEDVDHDWVPVGSRRVIDYSGLPHGNYRFLVRAGLPNGKFSESQFAFIIVPYFFETRWFFFLAITLLAASIYGVHLLRLGRIQTQFALVSEERAKMAREIHDTLAQGFVGISTQLDAVALKWEAESGRARQHLDLARRMARHNLTEARRSVTDLRALEREEEDLPATLAAAARRCLAGSDAQVQMEIDQIPWKLTNDLEQNLLRILQEAVTNAVKHSRATLIHIALFGEGRFLWLRVKDDGEGFEPSTAYSVLDGHFGILGMRERAERMGGEFALTSTPGIGTRLEVKIPVSAGKES